MGTMELTWIQSEALKIIRQKDLGELLDTGEFENDTEEGIFNLLKTKGVDVLQIEAILDTLKDKRYIDNEFTITPKGEDYLQLEKEKMAKKQGTVINQTIKGDQNIYNTTIENESHINMNNGVASISNTKNASSGGLLRNIFNFIKNIFIGKEES